MAVVSIIMASYNYAGFIGEAIESVLAQTFQDWELLVVEDGSTDGSCAVIENFCRKDQRIKMLFHPGKVNRGLAATISLGVSRAGGKYIAFLESDDKWHPENLACKISEFERFPEVALVDDEVGLFGDEHLFARYDEYWRIREKYFRMKQFPANVYTALFYENLIPTFSCAVCRADVLKKCSFDHIYAPHLDRSLWLQICRKHDFYHVKKVLTCWRIHPDSCISREKDAYRRKFLRNAYSILLPCYGNKPWSAGFICAFFRFCAINIYRSAASRFLLPKSPETRK